MFKKAKDLLKKLNKIDTNTLDDDDSSEESSEIEPTEWMRKCGHNCQMWQTKRCCACSDTRPLKQLYPCYVDGTGYITINNNSNNNNNEDGDNNENEIDVVDKGVKREAYYCMTCQGHAYNIYSLSDYEPYQKPKPIIASPIAIAPSTKPKKKRRKKRRGNNKRRFLFF